MSQPTELDLPVVVDDGKIELDAARGPFIGPTPFTMGDEKVFQGRRREARIVESLLVSSRLLLVYAPSGVGKTSLINAGVAPRLIRGGVDWRVASRLVDVSGVDEIRACDKLDVDQLQGDAVRDHGSYQGLRVVVFDQFEELYTASDQLEPAEVFALLARLGETGTFTESEPTSGADHRDDGRQNDVHVLLVLREDFYARFAADARTFWGRQPVEYRLGPLRRDAAEEAIVLPLQLYDVEIEPAAVTGLLDVLTQPSSSDGNGVRTTDPSGARKSHGAVTASTESVGPGERSSSTSTAERPSEGHVPVELVKLQIVCQRLWRRTRPAHRQEGRGKSQHGPARVRAALPTTSARPNRSPDVITADDVREHAVLNEAFREFVEGTITAVSNSCSVSRPRLMDWVRQHLLTPSNTRGLVFRAAELTEGLPNRVLDQMEAQGLVRAEQRGNDRWYELAHDSLVPAVMDSHDRIVHEHRWRWTLLGLLIVAVAVAGAILFVSLLTSVGEQEFRGDPDQLPTAAQVRVPVELDRPRVTTVSSDEVVAVVPVHDGPFVASTNVAALPDRVVRVFGEDQSRINRGDDNLVAVSGGTGDAVVFEAQAGDSYFVEVAPFSGRDRIETALLLAPPPLPRIEVGMETPTAGEMAAYQLTIEQEQLLMTVSTSPTDGVDVALMTADGEGIFPLEDRTRGRALFLVGEGDYVLVASPQRGTSYNLEIRTVDID